MKSLLEQILDRPVWMRSALCAQVDVGDLFFPEKGDGGHEAKAVCRACPVRLPCLEYALAADERHGIYGGLSARERYRLRPRRGWSKLPPQVVAAAYARYEAGEVSQRALAREYGVTQKSLQDAFDRHVRARGENAA